MNDVKPNFENIVFEWPVSFRDDSGTTIKRVKFVRDSSGAVTLSMDNQLLLFIPSEQWEVLRQVP
jgi:hypothetical protein